jgi:transcriptional regulator with XRE-family HTH domain
VSIGATLAGARQEAGLTVADVSARTYIRQSLIQAIEHDDFGGCGGDVYARGHIRAIATVVGADADALISDYDMAHHYGGHAPLDDLLRPPPPPAPVPPGGRRHGWLVPVLMLCCLVGVVAVAYQLTGSLGAKRPEAAASSKRPAAPAHAPSQGSPRPSHAKATPTPPPAPAAVPVTQLTPVSAAAFGPGGTSDGDNSQNASLALSGDPDTPWHTDWYTTARFGNLQAGTGLLVDLGRTVTATKVTIKLGSTPGADLQIRAGTTATDLRTVASAANAGGTTALRLTSHPRARYVLVWFTLLPPDAAGTYQATVSGVTVTATTGN